MKGKGFSVAKREDQLERALRVVAAVAASGGVVEPATARMARDLMAEIAIDEHQRKTLEREQAKLRKRRQRSKTEADVTALSPGQARDGDPPSALSVTPMSRGKSRDSHGDNAVTPPPNHPQNQSEREERSQKRKIFLSNSEGNLELTQSARACEREDSVTQESRGRRRDSKPDAQLAAERAMRADFLCQLANAEQRRDHGKNDDERRRGAEAVERITEELQCFDELNGIQTSVA